MLEDQYKLVFGFTPWCVYCAAFLEQKDSLICRSPKEALLHLGPLPGGVLFHCWLPLCILAAMHHSSLQANLTNEQDLSGGDTRTAPHILSHPHPPVPQWCTSLHWCPFLSLNQQELLSKSHKYKSHQIHIGWCVYIKKCRKRECNNNHVRFLWCFFVKFICKFKFKMHQYNISDPQLLIIQALS